MKRTKIKDQPYTNLLMPKGSAAGREDQAKQRARIAQINQAASHKIFVPFSANMEQRKAALALRAEGKHIVSGLPGQVPNYAELQCFYHLAEVDGEFKVIPV
ncbi:MAG: hypothetical protein V7725_03945 [Porticoccus sp.]